ncbi:IclR family transcriptional regulator [Sphingomonas canadensis]|uniref:IclR family transcriptional regulator n=1 Tax=Sphingomonas canadensis TaxID=1219257 RepID=A0ABW3H796_9SPHN|nr:IclR family transcriptional regulator [Sphingomonas canadensis]MCW3836992.1 IclR family transcriptional regulator [Sphingomonas canadensis]
MESRTSSLAGARSIARALDLVEALTHDGGRQPASQVCAAMGLAPSTGRRLVALLADRGFVARIGRGRYAGGPVLTRLAAQVVPHRHLIEQARPRLARLAAAFGGTAHLGMLENDMVTYLVKTGGHAVFTRESEQLEAYCTGIGKALLTGLSEDRIAAYLRGDFVRLTQRTITDPAALKAEIDRSRRRGYAIDDREMADDLACVAVPLCVGEGQFAISLSGDPGGFAGLGFERWARRLRSCAHDIAARFAAAAGEVRATVATESPVP